MRFLEEEPVLFEEPVSMERAARLGFFLLLTVDYNTEL
jgi:hypothetical protein